MDLSEALPNLFGPAATFAAWDESKHPRNRGKFARKGDGPPSAPGESWMVPLRDYLSTAPTKPEVDEADLDLIGEALREVVLAHTGSPRDACILAAVSLKRQFPEAELWYGKYDDQKHMLAKLAGKFIDVTADQFDSREDEVKIIDPEEINQKGQPYKFYRQEGPEDTAAWMKWNEANSIESDVSAAMASVARKQAEQVHRLAVWRAILGGQAVPAAVLHDYPDLVEQKRKLDAAKAPQVAFERPAWSLFDRGGEAAFASPPRRPSPPPDLFVPGYLPAWDEDGQRWVVGDALDLDDIGEEGPDAPDATFAADDWQPYTGPRGGKGWRNARTGRIEYGEHRPGSPEAKAASEAQARQRLAEEQQKPARTDLGYLARIYSQEQKVKDTVKQMFGDVVPLEEVHALFGVPGGATASVSTPQSDRLTVSVDHLAIDLMDRTLVLGADRRLVCRNQMFFLRRKYRGSGLGAQVFAGQVQAMASAGVDAIETCAGRGSGMNGYYTWPRLGYDCDLRDDWLRSMPRKARRLFESQGASPEEAEARAAALGSPKTVLDLMESEDGRKVWRKYGYMESMEFDLRPGSRSLATLNAYLASRGRPPVAIDEEKAARARAPRLARQLAENQRQARDAEKQQAHDAMLARVDGEEVAATEKAGLLPVAIRRRAELAYQDAMRTATPEDDLEAIRRDSWGLARREARDGIAQGDEEGRAQAERSGHDPQALLVRVDGPEGLYPYAARVAASRGGTVDHLEERRWAWASAIASANYQRHLQRIHDPELAPVWDAAEDAAADEAGVPREQMRNRARSVCVGLPDTHEAIRESARIVAQRLATRQSTAEFEEHTMPRLRITGTPAALDALRLACRRLGLGCGEATFEAQAARQGKQATDEVEDEDATA